MKSRHLMCAIGMLVSLPVLAASTATREAADRYAADRKLCADESSSTARMQCLRDARTEYQKALAAAKAAPAAQAAAAQPAPACADCGKVLGVKVTEKEGEGSALGMVAGGVAGALLGNQVGQGTGRDLATIAGAAGGAYAGHKIEQKAKSTKVWEVSVRFDNGSEKTFSFDHDPGFGTGDAVRLSGSSVVRR
ncbi:MAG: glycine zipper 2TM domain-containing protein [Proteobacteria bacterium]|nr:glycine zipper 2TM domain-containing protein [Pseudomonadota bacterium]HQR02685.1 glycine zipper 2TM domain-containing protein [Rhodocyclaceae bacterium]